MRKKEEVIVCSNRRQPFHGLTPCPGTTPRYTIKDFGPHQVVPGPWPSDFDMDIAIERLSDDFNCPPTPLGVVMKQIRRQTAMACLRLCTNSTDQEAIRKAFSIAGLYQVCPLCNATVNHKGECHCEV